MSKKIRNLLINSNDKEQTMKRTVKNKQQKGYSNSEHVNNYSK